MILAAISFFTDYWLPLQHGEETNLVGASIIVTMVADQWVTAFLAGVPDQ